MANRRDFLTAAALTAGSLALTPATQAATQRRPLALHAVLIEERFAPSRAFGARLAAHDGTPVLAVADGDITQLWLQQIGPAWRRHPVAVAGLTTRPALFCLEELAAVSGLRVVLHAEHILLPQARTEHQILRGAKSAGLDALDLSLSGPLWPTRMADAVALHRSSSQALRVGPSDAALEPAMPEGAQLLTSWIIAPA
jgi:hypothetical protein